MTTAKRTGEQAQRVLPRLAPAEALELYRDSSIHELGRRAHEATMWLHPEPYRTYVVDRNINYSNICTARCSFCNFKAEPGSPEAYVLSYEQIGHKVQELVGLEGTQILMQGGLAPAEELPFSWYEGLLRYVKQNFPGIHIHAFSPPEISAFSLMFGMGVREVLVRLQEAGLDTIPGGGAEILVDRVRRKIGQGKSLTDEYLEVMRQAHRLGMRTSMTMMFGHLETWAERLEHLSRIRDLQEETGGFTAFICWTFQPERTPLGRKKMRAADCPEPPDGRHVCLSEAHDYLKTLAICRLFLHNVANLQASWVTQGPKIGQLALFFGANDMGSVMMEENVVSAAGTTYRLTEQQIAALITDAGWQPKRRNCYYEVMESGG